MVFSLFISGVQSQILKDSITSESIKDRVIEKVLFDMADSVIKIEDRSRVKKTSSNFSFSLFPLTTDVLGEVKALVTAVSTSFYLGHRENNNLSEMWFVPYIDFEGRYGMSMWSCFWLKKNKWMLRG
jgi:hypothetical protein